MFFLAFCFCLAIIMSKYFCTESRTADESFASVGELIRNDFYSSPDERWNCFRGQILCSHSHLFFHLVAHWFLCVISSRPQAASQAPHRENQSLQIGARARTHAHTSASSGSLLVSNTVPRAQITRKRGAKISHGRSAERWICIWWRHLFCGPKWIYN